MKRLSREPEKFDPIELYSAMSRQQGYKIGIGDDLEDFKARIVASLKAALGSPIMLHGKRVEAMFAYVLAALGSCRLVKQEDSGSTFASSDDLQIPDYRVITDEGELLLIEVKNFHMKELNSRFRVKRLYLQKLREYAEMNKAKLKIAVYFSRINKWTLLSPESFLDDGRRVYIDLPHGIARNELSRLGDRMIATLPPLSLELIGDPQDKGATIRKDGSAVFTIREVRIKCDGRTITNDVEKNIAFYLMRYGTWEETKVPAHLVEGRIAALEFVFTSDETQDDQPFRIIGDLSSMVSSAFKEMTERGSDIVSLDVKNDPSSFQIEIPMNYKGKDLPLWQFSIKPNPDFRCQ